MNPAEKQQQFVARFSVIEDGQERLQAIVDWARKLAPLRDAEKVEENRVQGCTSRVWLIATVEEGRCKFRVDADSALVKALAAIHSHIYSGARPAEVAGFDCTALEALRLADRVTPTRLHGLAKVREAIQTFAAQHADD